MTAGRLGDSQRTPWLTPRDEATPDPGAHDGQRSTGPQSSVACPSDILIHCGVAMGRR